MQFKNTAILLIHCPDKEGIVAAVTDFLFRNHGNVVELEQHVDKDSKAFFMRVEWQLENFTIEKSKIDDYFGTLVGRKFEMSWTLHFSDKNPRMAIFVSKASHCLYDILSRYQSKEWAVEIPLIISNHQNLAYIAERFDIPFYHVPITKETKAEQEAKHLELLAEHDIDFIVLARYMQIISDDFITHFPNRIINIHHSFLPAFIGAKPYHQAFERGVKIIGATSHYVTQELDAGPIIAQDVAKITHKESVQELITKGKDLEKLVLSTGIALHLQHKVLSYGNKTVIFN
jgi:formyltetrahydrofolate deformylase